MERKTTMRHIKLRKQIVNLWVTGLIIGAMFFSILENFGDSQQKHLALKILVLGGATILCHLQMNKISKTINKIGGKRK